MVIRLRLRYTATYSSSYAGVQSCIDSLGDARDSTTPSAYHQRLLSYPWSLNHVHKGRQQLRLWEWLIFFYSIRSAIHIMISDHVRIRESFLYSVQKRRPVILLLVALFQLFHKLDLANKIFSLIFDPHYQNNSLSIGKQKTLGNCCVRCSDRGMRSMRNKKVKIDINYVKETNKLRLDYITILVEIPQIYTQHSRINHYHTVSGDHC